MTGGLKSWCSCFKNRRKRIKSAVENRLFFVGISVLFVYWRTKVRIQKRQKNKNFRVLTSLGRVLFHIVSQKWGYKWSMRLFFCIIKTRRCCPWVELMLYCIYITVGIFPNWPDYLVLSYLFLPNTWR